MEQPCVLCCSKTDDEMIFGKVHKEEQVVVHCNCLYLSSNLVQNGNDRHGILHFLKKDILMEVRRCRVLRCFYCQRLGANIGCCRSKCRRNFHTKCGFDNLAVSQFSDSFNSYCHQHVPKYRFRPGPEELCMICFESLVPKGDRFKVAKALQSPCCRNGWYHRQCLQMYANSAGYFFKCPLCNDEEKFCDVALYGISIPNCDAAWELEPNAFADQLQRAQHCTASKCRLRSTTSRIGGSAGADLLYCIMCGSNPMHTQCTSATASTYRCADCIVVKPSVAPHPAECIAEDDVFERYAELQDRLRNSGTSGHSNTRDLRHSKLIASMPVSSESDDEDDFEKVVRILNQSRQLRPKAAPGTSSSSAQASADRPVPQCSRRTLPATIPEQNENENNRASKRRKLSSSPVASPPTSRRFLQPISPRATAALSNVVAGEGRRRHTMPNPNARYAAPERINMNVSCVANRTRTRLPTYMANQK